MEVIESWIDHNQNAYAIVRYSAKEQRKYSCKEYEPMWLDRWSNDFELNPFGGSVGFIIPEFDTIEEAQAFLLEGITRFDQEPEIWWNLVSI